MATEHSRAFDRPGDRVAPGSDREAAAELTTASPRIQPPTSVGSGTTLPPKPRSTAMASGVRDQREPVEVQLVKRDWSLGARAYSNH